MQADDQSRQIVWRLFCPRCLTAIEGHEHAGPADLTHDYQCARCRKGFVVKTGVGAGGVPVCLSTPVFIRKPEVMEDNAPVKRP